MLGLILVLSRYVVVGGVVQMLGFLLLFKPFMAIFGFCSKGFRLLGNGSGYGLLLDVIVKNIFDDIIY